MVIKTQHLIRCSIKEYMNGLCSADCWEFWACKARYDQTNQRIADNMEQFYNPSGHRETLRRRRAQRKALQSVFVGGLPYDNY